MAKRRAGHRASTLSAERVPRAEAAVLPLSPLLDPHTPYLPPPPFDRMFYGGDEKDTNHHSMDAVWRSPWFANYFSEWMQGVRDIEFVRAQYDAEVAYTDLCISHILNRLDELGIAEETLLILHADHGEELDDHGCWFDHHGLYDTNVRVPLLMLASPAACPRVSSSAP